MKPEMKGNYILNYICCPSRTTGDRWQFLAGGAAQKYSDAKTFSSPH